MVFEQLKDKAKSLPMAPGVYLMKDASGQVIYVGKAKKLKNRVSQYFQDTSSHSPKTRLMIKNIDSFDVIIAASEFEALVLECSLIKQYLPKYNILLKDDKGYPYLRINMKEEYPVITMANKPIDDGAEYYGPFGSRANTQGLLDEISQALKLPRCGKKFPRDIGKSRPCLNYHMDHCAGWCQRDRREEYRTLMEQARRLLSGNYKQVSDDIHKQMLAAADSLNFELAAQLRNRLRIVESLGQKQLVTAGTLADTDVIGFASTETRSCFTVLHYSGGNLLDKDFEILTLQDDPKLAVASLLKQYYLQRGYAPRRILLPFDIEDAGLFSVLLEEQFGRKAKFIVPRRGDNLRLVELACTNAHEEARRVTSKEEKISGTLVLLGKLLSMDVPRQIESFDISHISGTDIVASMVVFRDGKPHKSSYKRFKLDDMDEQDDYGAMRQVLARRFLHYLEGDKGFECAPDLLLIDGGSAHAQAACEVLQALDLKFPVFGMVKDDRHRTRALVTASGEQIGIDSYPAVFSLIGNIQEETHRFAITYHRHLRSKRLRYSRLDQIPGIGPKRKEDLLRHFGSLREIERASVTDLERVLPVNAAYAVYNHFHKE